MQWTIDPTHSQAEFAIRHMFTTVHGHIVVAEGILQTDEEDLAKSAIWARLDPSSINTGVSMRDDHLRSADFFDVERHPEIRFPQLGGPAHRGQRAPGNRPSGHPRRH